MSSSPLIENISDRLRAAKWLDGQLAHWQAIRNAHGGGDVQRAAGNYIDALLTVRRTLVGRTKARKRTNE